MRTSIAGGFLSVLVCLLGTLSFPASAQPEDEGPTSPDDIGSFFVYTAQGERLSLDAVAASLDTVDVLFVGEVHDDPTAHALQDSLFRQIQAYADSAGRAAVLSLEMFERDVQPVLDEYLAGTISERHFVQDARAWPNYAQAYRPLVEAARAAGHPVLAANAPRRYVNRVAQEGPAALSGLSAWAQEWLPPLPYPGPTPAYREKWTALMREAMPAGHGSGSASTDTTDASDATHTTESPHATVGSEARAENDAGAPSNPHAGGAMSNMLQAQSLWDAAMAHAIARHLLDHPGSLVMHVTGGFHVSQGTGTPDALRHYRPDTRTQVVMIRPVDDPSAFDGDEHAGLGDVVILTDADRVPSRQKRTGQEPD